VNALVFDWNTAEDQRAWRYLLTTATALARKAPIQERCEALHVDAVDLATAIVEELAVGLEGADRVGGVLTRDFGEYGHRPRARRDRKRWSVKVLIDLEETLVTGAQKGVLKLASRCGFYGVEWAEIVKRIGASQHSLDIDRVMRAWWGSPNGRGRASVNRRTVRQSLIRAMLNELKTLSFENTSFPDHASIDRIAAAGDTRTTDIGHVLDELDFMTEIQYRERIVDALIARAVRQYLPAFLGCPDPSSSTCEIAWWDPSREVRVASAQLELLALNDLEQWTRAPEHLAHLAHLAAKADPQRRPVAKHSERLARQARRGRAQVERLLLGRIEGLAPNTLPCLKQFTTSFESLCAAARHQVVLRDEALFNGGQTISVTSTHADTHSATLHASRYILCLQYALRLFYTRDRAGIREQVLTMFSQQPAVSRTASQERIAHGNRSARHWAHKRPVRSKNRGQRPQELKKTAPFFMDGKPS